MVQISTTFLLSSTDALVDAFELDVLLDELDRAVGAGRHRLHRRAGEPVDHRAAGDQAEQERRVQDRQLRDRRLVLEALGQRHDDREDHRRRADHRGADQHRLGGRLEGVAGAVVLLEQLLGHLEVGREAELLLDLLPRCRGSLRSATARRPTARCRSPGRSESTAIVTGPMPRKPKATRPNAKIAGATIIGAPPTIADDRSIDDTR